MASQLSKEINILKNIQERKLLLESIQIKKKLSKNNKTPKTPKTKHFTLNQAIINSNPALISEILSNSNIPFRNINLDLTISIAKKISRESKRRKKELLKMMSLLYSSLKKCFSQFNLSHKISDDSFISAINSYSSSYFENTYKLLWTEYTHIFPNQYFPFHLLGPLDINTITKSIKNIKYVNWKLLPPGESSIELITSKLKEYERYKCKSYFDYSRLYKMFTLKPNRIFVGINKWIGYIVYEFDHFNKVALDCPKHGNAVYILPKEWQELSMKSKQELLNLNNSNISRVCHHEGWLEDVIKLLNKL